jgi:hypothetical protein
MKLTKKQAIKFKNNPNVNPITNLIFTQGEAEMYQAILDAYINFISKYLETRKRRSIATKNESYYCDNFSEYNNNEKQEKHIHNEFLDDCNSDTEL